MNEEAKKKLLRMIPHALYVLTSRSGDKIAAATVSWVTQASFQPPLLAVGLKKDSFTHQVVREAGGFALNFLGEGQKEKAQSFFKHLEPVGNTLSGENFTASPSFGFPVFNGMAGFVECRVLEAVDRGDHLVVVAEVLEASLGTAPGLLLLSSTGWSYGG
jgi:flavin reductase (DIM6/NTAB) family NADH-FMN oxidoreductase RutF